MQSEINRCYELLKLYKKIPTGDFGAMIIKQNIVNAEKAIANDDVIEMVRCCKKLKSCE